MKYTQVPYDAALKAFLAQGFEQWQVCAVDTTQSRPIHFVEFKARSILSHKNYARC